jgi:hypothetical protein
MLTSGLESFDATPKEISMSAFFQPPARFSRMNRKK